MVCDVNSSRGRAGSGLSKEEREYGTSQCIAILLVVVQVRPARLLAGWMHPAIEIFTLYFKRY